MLATGYWWGGWHRRISSEILDMASNFFYRLRLILTAWKYLDLKQNAKIHFIALLPFLKKLIFPNLSIMVIWSVLAVTSECNIFCGEKADCLKQQFQITSVSFHFLSVLGFEQGENWFFTRSSKFRIHPFLSGENMVGWCCVVFHSFGVLLLKKSTLVVKKGSAGEASRRL